MNLSTTVRNERFRFDDLRAVFAKANEVKSGDQLAGIAATSERERVAAKRVLAELTLAEVVDNPLIDPDSDEVSRLILDGHNRAAFFRDLRPYAGRIPRVPARRAHGGCRARRAASRDHSRDRRRRSQAHGEQGPRDRGEQGPGQDAVPQHDGRAGVLGVRVQPNHPRDDLGGILLAALDGLLLGGGDAVIGVNPVSESVETTCHILRALDRLIEAYQIPTQACCLAHISTQLEAMDRGAPVDLLFQSVAGTEAAHGELRNHAGDLAGGPRTGPRASSRGATM